MDIHTNTNILTDGCDDGCDDDEGCDEVAFPAFVY